MRHGDRIDDALLHAYVDEQLDARGRFEVEDFLRRNPDAAADVLNDRSVAEALRLLSAAAPAPIEELRTWRQAHLLQRALQRRGTVAGLRRVAAGIALFALGWAASLGWSQFRAPVAATPGGSEQVGVAVPSLVQQAVLASRRPLLGTSAGDTASLDPQKVGKALSIVLPRMPGNWRLAEMHVIPRAESPALQLVIDTPDFGRLALYATSTKDVGLTLPTITSVSDKSSAYWQLANDQYVLTGNLAGEPLELAALELYQTLY
jgi:anti-sigma factor RsiW